MECKSIVLVTNTIRFERPNDKLQKPNNIQISISNIQAFFFFMHDSFKNNEFGFWLFDFAICLEFIFCRLLFIMSFLKVKARYT